MKNLLLFFVLCLIMSCGSTKKITHKKEKQTALLNDTLKVSIDTPKKTPPELNNTEKNDNPPVEKVTAENKNTPEAFNQVLSKRFNEVHKTWEELLQKHVSNNGAVNYNGFKSDRIKLNHYFKALDAAFPNKNSSKAYQLAYWINAYNAFTVDLILRHYPVNSIKDIKDPWGQRYWKLGEKWYNLNDIEHQILRKMDEPRIHFAIVCASYSCPKLQNYAFVASNLEDQLTLATKVFLNDHSKNNISENSIELSKIFQWFAKDFKQNGSLIDFLNQYSDIKISDKAKKRFKDYDWNLNE
ncbi:DUF547 domain-containing protein [Tamlana sp. 2201CG12-4]|uniref:DUF547 domain-containing protein n=1 Tax=Tamlana sp. 2201CG12-4 TaxID=3112582 RepID=UPI002DB7910C|nr:DUF547 domain-containing protein [Tamlana sp. 2201CG12-4]MEC3906818.1 DUF547 domain-containing protein [Tamlana sp. 2201CG12-4]